MNIRVIETPAKPYVMYFLGDIHEGAANHNEQALKRAVQIISNDADGWLGLGDYIDAINHRDPRFNPMEIASKYQISDLDDLPQVQCDYLMQTLQPIADKCLGLLYGNHEDTYKKHNTFDVVNHLSKNLQTSNLGHKCWISLLFRFNDTKSIPIKIVAMHGTGGGGMREGSPINKVHDLFRWDMADCHIIGHLHQAGISRPVYNRFEYGTVRREPAWFAVNGCFLNKSEVGSDGYFEQAAGMESTIGMLRYEIKPSREGKTAFTHNLEMIYL